MSCPSTGSPRPTFRPTGSRRSWPRRAAELSTFEPLVDSTASRGAALAMSAEDDGLSLATRSVLDPDRSDAEPGFFAAFEALQPGAAGRARSRTRSRTSGWARRARRSRRCCARRPSERPGIAAGFTDLIENLRGDSDVDLQGDLLEALGGEAAFAVVPREAGRSRGGRGAVGEHADALSRVPGERRRRGPGAGGAGSPPGPDRPVTRLRARRTGVRPAPLRRPRRRRCCAFSPVAQILYATLRLAAPDRQRRGGGRVAGRGGRRRAWRTPTAIATRSTAFPTSPPCSPIWTCAACWLFAERSGLAEDTAYSDVRTGSRRLGSLGLAVSQDGDTLACRRQAAGRLTPAGPTTRYPAATMTSESLSDNEFLFTSESVTEGHPDKVADQISDGVLDAVLADDPYGRVACETLVNTGLVVVSGEISTETYVDIQDVARSTIREDRLQRRRPRVLGRLLRRHQRDRQAVARHRPGRRPRARGADRSRRRRRARRRGRGRPGNDVRLRDARDAGADAAADLAGAQARTPARRGPQGRGRALPAARRQDPGHGSLRERPARSRSRRS